MFQCPLCRSNRGSSACEIRQYSLMRCADCGVLSTFPIPQQRTIEALYDKQYYQGDAATRFGNPAADFIQRLFRWKRAWHIRQKLGARLAGSCILDVGCERGYMLAWLKRWKADVYGVQISKPAAAVAARLIGADRVWVGDLAGANYPNAFFDYITVWHVLEHVPDPIGLLREIRRILKPEGIVYIEVPNAGGYSARVFGAAWLAYDVPRHLVHFGQSQLRFAAARAGFTIQAESHFSFEYSPVTLLQSVLNKLLGGEHRLFQALSQPKAEKTWKEKLEVFLHLAAAVILAAPVTCASMLMAALHQGETLGVYLTPSFIGKNQTHQEQAEILREISLEKACGSSPG